ncbi:unnamed protein product [Prorocentrum cordatum]|uniref:C2H2-type domain-containing protein n=1 Tax=Prorocentrum cordatum TaxID=2364126 RepID=A0ABN9Q1H5_9DINO|nr:unnamed protein product [Polarella glacialis]
MRRVKRRPSRSARGGARGGRGRSPQRWATAGSGPSSPARSATPSPRSPRAPAGAAGRKPAKRGAGASAGSFKAFVLGLDLLVTPEDAVAKWQEHVQALAVEDLERLQGTGVYFDLYHPLAAVRRHERRLRAARQNAEVFMRDLQEKRYEALRLSTAAQGPGDREGATCRTTGHMKPPHFAFDPNVNSVLFSKVSPHVRMWHLHDALQKCLGLVSFSFTDPAPGSLVREARAGFETAEAAQAALDLWLSGERSLQGHSLSPSEPVPREGLKALAVPPEMSLPGRICKDAALSAQVVRRLDGLTGVPASVTESLLAGGGSEEARLDLRVLYLRRVHHFCFYAAEWCPDEWELSERCGAGMVRTAVGEDAGAVAPGPWTEAHEQRLAAFLETSGLQQPVPMSSDEQVTLDKKAAELIQEKTKQIAEGKYQCTACSKLFRGPEFVRKHLHKMHMDLFETIQEEIHAEAARKAFLAKPIRSAGMQQRKVA